MTRSGTRDDTSGSSEAPTAAAAAEALMGASGRASTNAAFRSSVLDRSASAGLVRPSRPWWWCGLRSQLSHPAWP